MPRSAATSKHAKPKASAKAKATAKPQAKTKAATTDQASAKERPSSLVGWLKWGVGLVPLFIRKRKEWQHRYKKQIILGNIAFVLLVILGIVIGMHIFAPDLTRYYERSQVLYDQDGNLIYSKMNEDDYYRISTTVDDVDPLYLKMLIAAEDERFYHHIGVDSFAIVRAMGSNLESGTIVSGASTITMQVCRLLEPKERTIFNKVKEALGALYLTFYYGREQVLNMYLTLAPFGGNIEGVTAASYMYFKHSPKHLTPAEAALLVALPRAPEAMRPDRHPKTANYYRKQVLAKAVTEGVISQDIMGEAQYDDLPTARYPMPQLAYHLGQSLFTGKLQLQDLPTTTATATVATEAAASVASAASTASAEAANAANSSVGRELHTTIDSEVQQILNQIAAQYQLQYPESSSESIALLAVDNQSFEVKGYVGAASVDVSYVDAVQALRSPGSALKPFAYAMAFEQGLLHPNSILLDISRLYRSYQPRNYDRKFFGEITASAALQASLNLPALEVMRAIGPLQFINHINQFANAKDSEANHRGELKTYTHGRLHLMPYTEPHLGLILGAGGISLYDMTQLYAALAHDGKITTLKLLQEPRSTSDATSVTATANANANAGAGAATDTSDATMDDVTAVDDSQWAQLHRADAARATYNILENTPVPYGHLSELKVSYKTGTSYKYRDTWALGSKDNLTVGVWTGRLDGRPSIALSGFEKAAPVLFQVMEELPTRKLYKDDLRPSVLLEPLPPMALTRVDIKEMGLVQKRGAHHGNTEGGPKLAQLGDTNDSSNVVAHTDRTPPLEITFPLDGTRLQVGASARVMLSFKGGQSPYYVLINDELSDSSEYFIPEHNGFYTVTVIDKEGNSKSAQVYIQGVAAKDDSGNQEGEAR